MTTKYTIYLAAKKPGIAVAVGWRPELLGGRVDREISGAKNESFLLLRMIKVRE